MLESWVFAAARAGVGEMGLTSAVHRDLRRAYDRWETGLEFAFAAEVLASRATAGDYPLDERFERLVSRELSLAGPLGVGRSVLFIGSGPFPNSAMKIHFHTGVSVRCLDTDPRSVDVSRSLLHSLDLHRAVRIDQGAGERADIGDPVLVVIALLAKPMAGIIEHLWNELPVDCTVVLRTSTGHCQLLYEPSDAAVEESAWRVTGCSMVNGSGADTISSLSPTR